MEARELSQISAQLRTADRNEDKLIGDIDRKIREENKKKEDEKNKTVEVAQKPTERLSKEQQKLNVQTVVAFCLQRKQELFKKRKEIEDVLRVMNMTLEDLKDGRLDRILEMQQKDSSTIDAAGFEMKEGQNVEVNDKGGKWYKPYFIHFADSEPGSGVLEINCSATKDFAVGTYLIGTEKEVIHFRK